jgi:hypothetical protein
MIKIRVFLLSVGIFCWVGSHSQTQQQWAQTVNWDGVSHWSKYILTNAAHMGPNALQVPAVGNGNIDSNSWIGLSAQFHFSPGDKTQSVVLTGNYCLVKKVISFDLSYIPVEYYSMTDTLKKQRHVYYKVYNDKKAGGDVILNTNIRLLKKWEKKIQLALRIGFRFPSSSGFAAARFTDNMGYYLDISAGKPIGNSAWKWIGMAGFYCWEIEKENLRQNDAFLFGTGLEWNKNGWRMQTTIAGYLGYLEHSGDKPIVFRAGFEKKLKRTGLLLKFQQGIHDFKYSTVEFGGRYFF